MKSNTCSPIPYGQAIDATTPFEPCIVCGDLTRHVSEKAPNALRGNALCRMDDRAHRHYRKELERALKVLSDPTRFDSPFIFD
jgi:hypothetical protein